MTDFQIRSDSVDVEQIMRQIRTRIREKRGVDYTEEEIKELANARLEKFLDPKGVRSDLIEQFRQTRDTTPPPNFKFEDATIFETHRPLLRWIRNLLKPILKLFFNPTPISDALHIQAKLNERHASEQAWLQPLYYEMLHNLVIETTRLGIEVKNLKMRLESMSSRLDFDERRARALEGVVQYRPGAVPPLQPPTGPSAGATSPLQAAQQERRTRRRRRRGRKTGFSENEPRPGFSTARSDAAGESSAPKPPAATGSPAAPAATRGGSGEVPPPAFAPGDRQGGSGAAGHTEGTEPVATKPRGDAGGEVG